ncbi:MAG: maf protein [Bacillales bacterium]|nr:maf protein [Bacillales bacterium]
MLLEQFNIDFEIITEEINEENYKSIDPINIAKELSANKAMVISSKHEGRIILAADTIVVYDDNILGKPKNIESAREMMRMLSGNVHNVITGCTIISKHGIESFAEITKVKFYKLLDSEIEAYLAFNDYSDKAGGYGIQGAGGMLVEWINGDYYNVVGLPISKVIRKIKQLQEGKQNE